MVNLNVVAMDIPSFCFMVAMGTNILVTMVIVNAVAKVYIIAIIIAMAVMVSQWPP